MLNKKGNETLQSLLIIAIIGALGIAIVLALASSLGDARNKSLTNIGGKETSTITKTIPYSDIQID